MMIRKLSYVLFLLVSLAGCTASLGSDPSQVAPDPGGEDEAVQDPASAAQSQRIPNPASVYCVEHGGVLEFRQDAQGGVSGVCVFPDGSECEEWAYFRGECQPGQTLPPAAAATQAD